MGEAPDGGPSRPAAERAEEFVARVAPQAGRFVALAGLRILKVAALAREEAEDIWAEAQSIRSQVNRTRE